VIRSLVLLAALGLGLGCSRPPGADSAAPADADAATARAASPEDELFPQGRSLLLDAEVLKLVPRECFGVVMVAGIDALGATLPTPRLRAPDAQQALTSLVAELTVELSKDLPDPAALEAAGIDTSKPMGVVLLDDELRAIALFAGVRDEAKVRAELDKRKGSRTIANDGDALVLQARQDVTRAVVLRKGQLFVLRAGASYEAAVDNRIATWSKRLATSTEDASLSRDQALMQGAEQVAYGSLGAAFLRPAVLLAAAKDQIAHPRSYLGEESKEQQAARQQRLERLAALTATLDKATSGLVVGLGEGAGTLLVRGLIMTPAGGPLLLGAARALPAGVAELRPTSLRFYGALDPSLLEVLPLVDSGIEVGIWHPLGEVFNLEELRPELTGDVVLLANATAAAFGIKDATHVRAMLAGRAKTGPFADKLREQEERSKQAPPGEAPSTRARAYEIDPVAGTAKYQDSYLRVTNDWLVLAEDRGFVDRFPAPTTASPLEPQGVAAKLRAIRDTSAELLWPVVGEDRFASQGDLGRLDATCAVGFGLMLALGKPTDEEKKKNEELCKELEELESKGAQARAQARAQTRSLLGRAELVAKPVAGGAAIYGALEQRAADLNVLAEALITAWLPAAPSSDQAKRIAQLRAELDKLQEDVGKRGAEGALGRLDFNLDKVNRAGFDSIGPDFGDLGVPDSRAGGLDGGQGSGVSIGGLGQRGGSTGSGRGNAASIGELSPAPSGKPKPKTKTPPAQAK